MSDNTKIWRAVEHTDPRYMKEVKYPFKHLSIDAQYQILQATKLWGPMGEGWGVKDEKFQAVPLDTKNVCTVIYSAVFFHPTGEFGINSSVFVYEKAKETYKANNDFAKKVSTDALTKGLSKLGFSADIFMGKYDGSKYDGIDSYDIDFSATDEDMKKLREMVTILMEKDADKAQWLDQEISKGLTAKRAKKLIERTEEFLK